MVKYDRDEPEGKVSRDVVRWKEAPRDSLMVLGVGTSDYNDLVYLE